MKEQTIKAMTAAGMPADKAEKYWATVRERLCDGDEPTAASLALLTDEDIMGALPGLAGRAFLKAIRATSPEKGRRFKADEARSYSATALVAFLAAEGDLSADDKAALRAEITRRTGGAPFRFVVDGKLAEVQTADRIRSLFDRDPVAPFVVIGGREVEPVGFDAEPVKTFAEDPFDRGVKLGQPDDVSVRLGMSLAGIGHETRQAIAVAMDHDLFDAPTAMLVQVAKDAAGKTADHVLANYPRAARAWQKMTTEQRPSLRVAARPEPIDGGFEPLVFPAPTGGKPALSGGLTAAPLVYVVGATLEPKAADMLRAHLTGATRNGALRLVMDSDCPAGAMTKTWGLARIADAAMVVVLMTSTTLAALDTTMLRATAARLVPVLVCRCLWQEAPGLGGLTALPGHDIDPTPAGTNDEQWADVASGITRAVRNLAVRTAPPSFHEVTAAIIACGLDRPALMTGIAPGIVASLPTSTTPASQAALDVGRLRDMRTLLDGSRPYETYLTNAAHLASGRREADVFRRALAAL